MRKYCKELGCFYGSPEHIYQGVLLNLNELPLNTVFNVANGAWIGQIKEIDGKKGYYISAVNRFIILDENIMHQLIWIDSMVVPEEFYNGLKFEGNNIVNDWFIFEAGTSIFEIRDFLRSGGLNIRKNINHSSTIAIDIVDEIHYKNNLKL